MSPKPRAALSKRPLQLADSFLFCPSCSRVRPSSPASRRQISSQRPSHPPTTPTFASSSAVNATKNIPDRFAELYKALKSVRHSAANHVQVSRLQLALRGLETETPIIRVAVLGLGNTATAAKLVRLLLADPLGPRADWEDYLDKYGAGNEGGLLVKYGEEPEITVANLMPTISIPSPILKKANLQIYISYLGVASERVGQLTPSTLYVPTISIPIATSGAHGPVRVPVHRTIICGEGIDGLLSYDRLAGNSNAATAESTRAVFSLCLPQVPQDPQTTGGVITFVDVDRAESALKVFRESVQNASEYERGWTGSGVQSLVDWLSKDYSKTESMHPDVKRLVASLLETAEESVSIEQTQKVLETQAKTVPDAVRNSLGQTVSTWSERAHTELRDTLNEGFMSKRWRDLAWWKLFWRVDDVSWLMAGILEKKWLSQAEKEAIWLSGKIQQAGLLNEKAASSFNRLEPGAKESSTASDNIYTTQLAKHRQRLINERVPALHSLAQGLVAFSLSTTTLTSALAALTYVSTSSTSIYEAGTLTAVGLIYSLRRQQKRWDEARHAWESEVREEGRKALLETEDTLRTVLQDGGRPSEPAADTEARTEIERAKKALSDVE